MYDHLKKTPALNSSEDCSVQEDLLSGFIIKFYGFCRANFDCAQNFFFNH